MKFTKFYSILDTVKPPLTCETSKKLCDIVVNYTKPIIVEESVNTELKTIYTVEDLNTSGSAVDNEPNNKVHRDSITEIVAHITQNDDEDDEDPDNKWKLAPGTF